MSLPPLNGWDRPTPSKVGRSISAGSPNPAAPPIACHFSAIAPITSVMVVLPSTEAPAGPPLAGAAGAPLSAVGERRASQIPARGRKPAQRAAAHWNTF